MKDEELAEEIANKRCHEIMCYGHCSFNSPKHHRCGEWHREYNCALEGIKTGRQDEQLAKAKELIEEYMRFEPMIGTCSFYSEEYEKTKTKAEQFLKEIEK